MAKKRVTRPPVDGEGGNLGNGNGGGDENPGAITGAAPISGKTPDGKKTPRTGGRTISNRDPATEGTRDNGDREAVSAAKLDKVYTADSKERWGEDQPSHQDLLKEKRRIDAAVEGRDDPEADSEEAE